MSRQTGAGSFRSEIAWRDFYADVLDQRPDSARHNYDRAFDALITETGQEARRLRSNATKLSHGGRASGHHRSQSA